MVSGTITTTFTYNGDGHRMSKGVDGVTTTYVVALLGLPQVVVETTGGSSTAYLYGHDLLGEEGTTWAWHLGDGLGSVRQLTDGDGDVALAQGYTPFGVLLWSEGSGASGYGFTGEQEDASVGLVFLRARYYDPYLGRFISKDPWPGGTLRPQTLNDFVYVVNNPINLIDPTGHDDWIAGPWVFMSAWKAIDLAKSAWSKAGLLRWCLFCPDDGQWPSDTINDLLTDFICEYGDHYPQPRVFNADAYLTQDLAKSLAVHKLRTPFYTGYDGQYLSDKKHPYQFDVREFTWATADALWSPATALSLITHWMGSFDTYEIKRTSDGKVKFKIYNETTLESGTRIPSIFGGVDLSQAEEAYSIEEIVDANPAMGYLPILFFLDHFPIISILETKSRGEMGGLLGLEGGGTMKQVYVWKERSFGMCNLPLWPGVQSLLELEQVPLD